jgi:sortase A
MSQPPSSLERVLIAIGCGCLTAVGINLADAASFQQAAARTLESQLVAASPAAPIEAPRYEPALVQATGHALIGRLEIPRLHMSVMVMDGDDDATLARAVGHVRGTALPWESGNAVMAGHRDTFFQPLKNLRTGDEIRMTTARGTFNYRVTRTEIVEPEDVSALAPTPHRSLTLVTCYPFVYVGPAPQRFVIHAR